LLIIPIGGLLSGKAGADVDINAVIRVLGSLEGELTAALGRVKVLVGGGISAAIGLGHGGGLLAAADLAGMLVGFLTVRSILLSHKPVTYEAFSDSLRLSLPLCQGYC
jgi:hypothetical protein